MITALKQTVSGVVSLSTSGNVVLARTNMYSLIVVAVGFPNNTSSVTSITDTQGNTYAKAVSSATTLRVEQWYAYVPIGGSAPTVTVNITPSGNADIIVREYTNMASSVFDAANFGSGTGTAATTAATAATSQAQELVVAAMTYPSGTAVGSAGANFGNYVNNATAAGMQLGMEDRTVLTSSTYTGDFAITLSSAYDSTVATFKAKLGSQVRMNPLRPHPFSPGLAR